MDWLLVLGGLGVGTVVGLTGMGGGALMTPMLVIFFGVDPVTAVSSDLVVSLVMKPFGAGVHAKEGTVNYSLVKWLCLGSVPAAFAGVLVLNALGGDDLANTVKTLPRHRPARRGRLDDRAQPAEPAARPRGRCRRRAAHARRCVRSRPC